MDTRRDQDGKGPAPSLYVAQDPEAFARNFARAIEQGARALAAYLKPRDEGQAAGEIADATTEVLKTLNKVGEYWTGDPARLMDAQTRLFANYFTIWQSAMAQTAGAAARSSVNPKPGDKRFNDADWTDNPLFSSLKQLYLATSRWAEELVEEAEGLDAPTRQKARFYIQQINNALAPTNFPLTNPEVLRETASTNAENLVKGMTMLAEDIEAGHGKLRLRQTDASHFKLGENVATTPGKVIFRNDICEIIQYAQATEQVFSRPLLIVPPWINKFYILDLAPEKSLIRWLVENGHTVFVVSWVNPDERHAAKTFEDYMREGILTALDVVEKATGEKKINAVGYCVGGTLLAVTLGYLARSGKNRIAAATLLTTQIDFELAGDLKVFIQEDRMAQLEAEMEEAGYLEGTWMANAFNMLRSNDLIWPYVVNNYMKGKEPYPFDLLFWNADATRLPAKNHAFYLRSCYLQNALAKGRLKIGGEAVDLSKVKVPIYNLATREDHIAPARSVFIGSGSFKGPVRFVLAGSGHIAGVVNPPGKKKYQYWTGGKPEGALEDWLKAAEEHPGSWWADWSAWLKKNGGKKVKKKRRPGGGRLKPLGDAPGSYVKVRI